MIQTCKTCYGSGKCLCGATDCVENCGGKCPDCYCDSCSEDGKKIVQRDDDGDNICDECAAERPKPGHCDRYDCAGSVCLCPCSPCYMAKQRVRLEREMERADHERDLAWEPKNVSPQDDPNDD